MKKIITLILIAVAFVMAKNCAIESSDKGVIATFNAHNCTYTMIVTKNNSEFQLLETCEDSTNAMYVIKKKYITSGIFDYEYELNEWDKYGVLITDKSGSSDIKPGEAWHKRITKYCK